MSLAGDRTHLVRLSGELPQQELAGLCRLIAYAGDEARIALGPTHPRADEMARMFEAFALDCGSLSARLNQLSDLLAELGG